jgi:hypothetical protein
VLSGRHLKSAPARQIALKKEGAAETGDTILGGIFFVIFNIHNFPKKQEKISIRARFSGTLSPLCVPKSALVGAESAPRLNRAISVLLLLVGIPRG